jgi:hypothetical protein
VVATETLADAVVVAVKSTTASFREFPVWTAQVDFGASTEQARKTLPVPAVEPRFSIVLPEPPAFTVKEGGVPIVGTGTLVAW